MAPRPTRRVILAAVLSAVATPPARAVTRPDPLAAAIRRARLADAAHRQAGHDAVTAFGPSAPRPAYWRAYRFGVLAERYSARRALHALTWQRGEWLSALLLSARSRSMESGCAFQRMRRIAIIETSRSGAHAATAQSSPLAATRPSPGSACSIVSCTTVAASYPVVSAA
ncbi:penicillin-binding protein [Methylorubrum suomiense]